MTNYVILAVYVDSVWRVSSFFPIVYADLVKANTLQAITTNTGSLIVSGYLASSGSTTYGTSTGFYLGSDGKFSLGGSGTSKLTWDTSALTVTGVLNATSGNITGALTVGTNGYINSSGKSYGDTNSGFFLGYSSSAYKV